jgi:hypothetical protein
MPIDEPKYKFVRRRVADAPEGGGIYALREDGELVHVGRASGMTIRQALQRHIEQGHCPCTTRATHYSWELSLRPATREFELLLQAFEARHQRLPRCNEEAA